MGCNYHSAICNQNIAYLSGYNKYGQLGCYNKNDNIVKFPCIIKQISCGNLYTFVLLEDNSIYVSGHNIFGQLGLGDTDNRYAFTKIPDLNIEVEKIFCGYTHTFILTKNSNIYVSGLNNYGQLGLGDTDNRYAFTKIPNLENVKQILCSEFCTLFVNHNSECYFSGYVDKLYFDKSFFSDSLIFYKLPILEKIKIISGNNTHFLFITKKNDIIVFGLNIYGTLGLNTFSLKENYKIITPNINIKDVKSGLFHNLILDAENNMYVCGRNNNAQLGINNIGDEYNISVFQKIKNNIKEITIGQCYSAYLTKKNNVYVFGNNNSKQLYIENIKNILKPTKIKKNIQLLWS